MFLLRRTFGSKNGDLDYVRYGDDFERYGFESTVWPRAAENGHSEHAPRTSDDMSLQ